MNTFTCSFFGHRGFCYHLKYEKVIKKFIKELIDNYEYVEFLVGKNGEFDQFASSAVLSVKYNHFDANSTLICVLPYATANYLNNQESYENYYDEIEICEESQAAYFKSAIQIRNREMVNRSDLIICYIDRKSGGAYQTINYAKKQNKHIINLAEIET